MPVLYKEYNISKDPERHGIAGASSGAIAAFTVAWQRPNDFRKVLSIVGSFVNLGDRGGDTYADIVRKSEKKPLRVFLQDGRNDNRGMGRGGAYDPRRDWFLQNVRLMRALTEKCFDVITPGDDTARSALSDHFPEMMRSLARQSGHRPHTRRALVQRDPRGSRAAFSAVMYAGAFVLPDVMRGDRRVDNR